MIGRAAVGNPWIFARLDRSEVSPEAVKEMMHQHLQRHMAFYGPRIGMMLFRKHAMQYLKLQRLPRATRTKILLQEDSQSFLNAVDEVYMELG